VMVPKPFRPAPREISFALGLPKRNIIALTVDGSAMRSTRSAAPHRLAPMAPSQGPMCDGRHGGGG